MSECPGVNVGVFGYSVTHQWKTNSQAVGRRYLSDCPGVNVGVVALVCHPSFEDELPSL